MQLNWVSVSIYYWQNHYYYCINHYWQNMDSPLYARNKLGIQTIGKTEEAGRSIPKSKSVVPARKVMESCNFQPLFRKR